MAFFFISGLSHAKSAPSCSTSQEILVHFPRRVPAKGQAPPLFDRVQHGTALVQHFTSYFTLEPSGWHAEPRRTQQCLVPSTARRCPRCNATTSARMASFAHNRPNKSPEVQNSSLQGPFHLHSACVSCPVGVPPATRNRVTPNPWAVGRRVARARSRSLLEAELWVLGWRKTRPESRVNWVFSPWSAETTMATLCCSSPCASASAEHRS